MKKYATILPAYIAGVVIGLSFWFLRLVGALKVKGWDNFPKQREKILAVSNHPYKGEQFLLLGLFFHRFLFRPFRCSPWSMADRDNYYDKPLYWLVRSRLIPVDRKSERGDAASLKTARKILASGGSLILFPEGGRTSKGTSCLLSPEKSKRMRPLKGGFAVLAAEPGVVMLPVWFEFDSWLRMRLTIGKSQNFNGALREEVVHRTQQILLELADVTS